jgi:hypothetical protein
VKSHRSRPGPDRLPVARKMHLERRVGGGRLGVDEDQADRLGSRGSARAGDSGHGNGDVGAESPAGALGHRVRDLGRDGTVCGEERLGDSEGSVLDLVRVGDDGAEERVTRAGYVREPGPDQAARDGLGGGEREAAGTAEVEDDLGRRTLVLREEVPGETLAQGRGERLRSYAAVGPSEEIDPSLEVLDADRHIETGRLTAGLIEGLRDRGLAGTEEAQNDVLGPLRPFENMRQRLTLDHAGPEPLQLSGRARERRRDAAVVLQENGRGGAREPEGDPSFWKRSLLPDPRGKIGVRPAEARGDQPGDRFDLGAEHLVDDEGPSRRAGERLDGAVVVRRAESSGEDAHVGRETLADGRIQFRRLVADDQQARGLEPEPGELATEEGAVLVGLVAAYELAARKDDDRTRVPT